MRTGHCHSECQSGHSGLGVLSGWNWGWLLMWMWMWVGVNIALGAVKPGPDAHRHWAFQKPVEPELPRVKNAGWVKTEVDRFILAGMEKAGLEPAPRADARTLIRRMFLDLTGLPPLFEEVQTFEADAGRDWDGAVRKWTDQLLASPRYGERWGRYWLDVARFSDTKGYVYAREERRYVHSASYRDWVIQSFNADLRYDRFLMLQIAADQLVPEGAPELQAMGFVTGGRRFLGVIHDIIDDRIDVVTRGALGLTVQCARCHDHKYDPIPIQDYYSLYGVFRGGDDQVVRMQKPDDEELRKREAKLAEAMKKHREEAGERLRSRVADYLKAQLDLSKLPEEGFDELLSAGDVIPDLVRRWRNYLYREKGESHSIFGVWHVLSGLSSKEWEEGVGGKLETVAARSGWNPLVWARVVKGGHPRSMEDLAERYGQLFQDVEKGVEKGEGAAELKVFLHDPRSPTVIPDTGIVNTERLFPTTVTEGLWKLQGDVDRRLIELGVSAALVLRDRETEPNPRVFLRGKASMPGEEVPRQFLGVLAGSARKPFTDGYGRRELAEAIVSRENPLTARVMVNRVWMHHFGSGLVKTPSDFGLRAERPSHPELLDWLAVRFMDGGWSIKSLHRMLLSSAVYQSRGMNRGDVAGKVDPDNRLLSHFPLRRLDFESLRDGMLQASGELDVRMGGNAVELMDGGNRRRTVYALVDRQFLPGTFRTFDFANPDIHVAVRHETTVPQQALYFLNGVFAGERARALSRRFGQLEARQRVEEFHRVLFQRSATEREWEWAQRFLGVAEAEAEAAVVVEERPVSPSVWSYGVGELDEGGGRVKNFVKLGYFTGEAWQGAAMLPGGPTGWAQLTRVGGHPGNTKEQACVRRWTSPVNGKVRVAGVLKHEPEQGDGVRGFVVASSAGLLRQWKVHHGQVDAGVEEIAVKVGDTLDFGVDIGGGLAYDQFLWTPVVTAGDQRWDAGAEFGGEPSLKPLLLSPWEQYVQVLLLSNEAAFVD